MSVAVEKLEKNMAKLTIEVSAEELEKAIQGAYQKQKNRINIPGFRKGKAPRKMIEKMYGVGVFYEDAANALIPEAYSKALDECEETIVSQPSIAVTQLESGKPFIFTAEVATKPEVTLGKYIGVTVTKVDGTVTDEDVTAAIDKEREKNARTINVEDRAIENGDTAVIDFEGFVDGVAFDGGKGENHSLEIGSGSFIPGFEDQLIGKNAGDDVDVNVTFPEEYHAEDLAGKEATFKVKIHEIKAKEIPELDDEFVKDVSEFDTLDELKADTKKKMLDHKQEHADEDFEHAVLDQLPALVTAEIPQLMSDRAAQEEFPEFNYRLQSQGIDFDTYLNYTGMERDAMMAMYRVEAETNVKTRLALEKIVELEQIEPAEDEIEAEYAKLAENYKMDIDKIKGVIPAADIKANLAMRKAIDLLKEHSVAKKKKATRKKKAATEEKPAEEPKAE